MTSAIHDISRTRAWILATRPKTLPAAIVPVMVGSAVAAMDHSFVVVPALMALLCALLIQIGTNLANDYFDFVKGADSEDRLGPLRVTQSGLIPPPVVKRVMILVFLITFLLGLYLVYVGGWPILLIGVLSILSAVAYTAGPYPLAYIGLGDLFVFIFFGVVAVTGTYYVQALSWSGTALAASLPIGAVSTAILVVNNYRDIDTDRISGKKTMAVRLGRKRTRIEFGILLFIAFAVPILQALFTSMSCWILLPLLGIPLAWKLMLVLARKADGESLNKALADTGRLLALFGVLYSLGFLFQ